MRLHHVMRHVGTQLAGLFFLFAVVFASAPVSAGNVYIRAGAEGVGQDAWLELNDADQFSMGLVGCKKSRGKLDLQLVLSVYGKANVPAELETLRGTAVDTTLGLDLCINGICEENEFRSESSAWGHVLLKDFTIERNQEKIRSIRVIVPNESMKYEYQGDVDVILKKICKETPSQNTRARSSRRYGPRIFRDIIH
jgi:hypothetical protein